MPLLAIRFIVELLGLAGLAYWGAAASTDPVARIALSIGAPLVLAVVWALIVAPKADNPLSLRARGLIGTAVLVLVAGALAAAGQPEWGIAFAVVVVVDQSLILVLGFDDAARTMAAMAHLGSN
jgi:hypothetical protein